MDDAEEFAREDRRFLWQQLDMAQHFFGGFFFLFFLYEGRRYYWFA